ncbi:MAG TPA: YegS/Rv2252/BmrU family lipid kinase [Chitinophagaceae bacterium]|nr:YegS/Rv2252/BmrU family lipid kinase [Chitinophagaceae bacterium]
MRRNIVFLVNPISGGAKKDSVVKEIEKVAKENELDYTFVPTNAEGDYEFLKDKITRDKVTDIVIVGGDGTANQVTNALRGIKIRFGIIPLGSGNGLAFAAGIAKKPLQALQHIIQAKTKPVDAFLINNHYSCMLSGIGFDASVAHDFAQQASRGLITYTQQTIINYFKAQPYQFEITINGFTFFTEAFFISIANSNQFGNYVTIAPHANLSDGLLDVVIVQKMNKAKLPFAVLKQLRGNNKLQQLVDDISKKTVLNFQAESLLIKNLKLAPLHVDGEPKKTEAEFNIRVLKHSFELIHP